MQDLRAQERGTGDEMDHARRHFLHGVEQFPRCNGNVAAGYTLSDAVFGAWNMFSFSACAGLGYLLLGLFHVIAKRTVHKMDLNNNLELVDVTFFNPFWKPTTITFHISEFQEPCQSYAGFIRFELTSIGKAWIKLTKNEFRGVTDYEETLDSILLGKKITNVSVKGSKNR